MLSKPGTKRLLAASMTVLFLSVTVPLSATAPPDATLFTTYNIDAAHTSVTWTVCGSTLQTEGCYDSGGLGPFGKVGALLEGNSWSNQPPNTVTRLIYVLDIASGSKGNGVTLYAYKKTDMVSPTFDTTTITLFRTVSLPLSGGSSALASMAANNGYIFIGTNQSPNGVRMQKSNFGLSTFGGFSPPINVSAITADQYGYVTVTFGGVSSFPNGFILFGPDGGTREDGGGAPFVLNTVQAVLPSTLP